jgi:uncharacterized YigZ family protein
MLTLTQLGEAEQTINKSRFIARALRCESERELALFLRRLAGEHASASHLAYAFRIKTAQGVVQRFSDAGEPSGTAGKPILQFLEGRDLINVGVGVIRYYGGINLGTGGLARAYGGTAKLAIEAGGLCEYVEMQLLKLVLEYKQLDYFVRELGKVGGELLQKNFNDKVEVIARLPAGQVAKISQQFQL